MANASLEQSVPCAALDQVRSSTIAINLTSDFVPESATVLSIDTTTVEGRVTLRERVFGSAAPRGLTGRSRADRQNSSNPLYHGLQRLIETAVGTVQSAIGHYTTTPPRCSSPWSRSFTSQFHLVRHRFRTGVDPDRPQSRWEEDLHAGG